MHELWYNNLNISIHALREEGDGPLGWGDSYYYTNFYPRPPRGGRLPRQQGKEAPGYFYPRPPRGGRPRFKRHTGRRKRFLSTPSVRRATGDAPKQSHGVLLFLSTPSVRRATARRKTNWTPASYFYPRPPRGGRRGWKPVRFPGRWISIHALREEGDRFSKFIVATAICISIHALRKEGDLHTFSSRPASCISIHALRKEGDVAQGKPCQL